MHIAAFSRTSGCSVYANDVSFLSALSQGLGSVDSDRVHSGKVFEEKALD